MMPNNDPIERAAREAYGAFAKTLVYNTVSFDGLNEHDQHAWYDVARSVIAEYSSVPDDIRRTGDMMTATEPSQPLTDAELARIRVDLAADNVALHDAWLADDAQTLLAEVDRLRAERDALRNRLDKLGLD
jgi:hypothetical protein